MPFSAFGAFGALVLFIDFCAFCAFCSFCARKIFLKKKNKKNREFKTTLITSFILPLNF